MNSLLKEENEGLKITCNNPGKRMDRDGIKYVAIFFPDIPPLLITGRYQISPGVTSLSFSPWN